MKLLNNLKQQAIAAYYDEDQPDLRNTYREPPVRTRSHMLLRPQFWRGQQNGARSGVVHARHMRPLCERVSSGKHPGWKMAVWHLILSLHFANECDMIEVDEIEDNPTNLVLFVST